MPASAVSTKASYRPKGWFTDREIGIVVNRVLRDDPSKDDMHNRMAITPKRLWQALIDYDLWPVSAPNLKWFAVYANIHTDIPHRPHRIRSGGSCNRVHHINSEKSRFQHGTFSHELHISTIPNPFSYLVQHQSPHHPVHRHLHLHPHRLNLDQRARQ